MLWIVQVECMVKCWNNCWSYWSCAL